MVDITCHVNLNKRDFKLVIYFWIISLQNCLMDFEWVTFIYFFVNCILSICMNITTNIVFIIFISFRLNNLFSRLLLLETKDTDHEIKNETKCR